MWLFSKPNSKPKIDGIIAYLHLEDFWLSCTPEEQNHMIRWHQPALGRALHPSPIEGKIDYSSNTRLKYLEGVIWKAANERRSALRDKAIRYAENNCYDDAKLVDKHFYLQTIAECFYKDREFNTEALGQAIEYCKRDIDLFPKYRRALVREMKEMPRIKTFQRLAVVYEKQERIEAAIDICKLAIKYNLMDSTKAGYKGRIARLEKKLK